MMGEGKNWSLVPGRKEENFTQLWWCYLVLQKRWELKKWWRVGSSLGQDCSVIHSSCFLFQPQPYAGNSEVYLGEASGPLYLFFFSMWPHWMCLLCLLFTTIMCLYYWPVEEGRPGLACLGCQCPDSVDQFSATYLGIYPAALISPCNGHIFS